MKKFIKVIDMLKHLFSICIFLAFGAVASSQELSEIDGRQAMLDVLGLIYQEEGEYSCPRLKSCSGLCAHQPFCVRRNEIVDLEIIEIQEINVDYPKIEEIPISYDREKLSYSNCLSFEWDWSEKVTVTSVQRLEGRVETALKNVQERRIGVSLAPDFLSDFGLKFDQSLKETVTVTSSSTETETNTETTKREQPFQIDVPPMTQIIVSYADGHRSYDIPVEIVAVVDGTLVKQDVISSPYYSPSNLVIGSVRSSSPQFLLSTRLSKEQRTLKLSAVVLAEGSNRDLDIRLAERALTSESPECQVD